MDNSEIAWIASSAIASCGAAAIGHEWYGIRLAERAIKTDINDMELFELCLYLRDKMLDHDG